MFNRKVVGPTVGTVLGCLIFLLGILSAKPTPAAADQLPEWFFKTSPGNRVGAIGFSYKYTADTSINAHQVARMSAVFSLREVIGNENFEARKTDIFELIIGDLSAVDIPGGRLVAGGGFVKDVSVFEYVYLDRDTSQPADEPEDRYAAECDFSACRPGWLCNQTNGDKAGFLGISYRASSPGRQLELTSANAIDLIQYMLGVDVSGKERFYQVNSSAMKIRFRQRSFDVNKTAEETDAVIYTKAQCFAGETLFSWKVSDDIAAYPSASGKDWITNGEADGLTGSVGSAARDLTGFVSRQLKNAYEDGISQLAKEQGVTVTTEGVFTQSTQSGRSSEIDTKVSFDEKVQPRISGVYMDERLRMYVWVTSGANAP